MDPLKRHVGSLRETKAHSVGTDGGHYSDEPVILQKIVFLCSSNVQESKLLARFYNRNWAVSKHDVKYNEHVHSHKTF